MGKPKFVAMLQIEIERDDVDVSTVEQALKTRAIVLAAANHPTSRLIAVIPLEYARLLMKTAEALGEIDHPELFVRPPPGYRKPD